MPTSTAAAAAAASSVPGWALSTCGTRCWRATLARAIARAAASTCPTTARVARLAHKTTNSIQTKAGCTINGTTTHNVGGDPLLAPLALNGGATPNHALGAGSPAIDAANPGGCLDNLGALLVVDQRGQPRPFGVQCDIGAYELGLILPSTVGVVWPAAALLNTTQFYTAIAAPLTTTLPLTFIGRPPARRRLRIPRQA